MSTHWALVNVCEWGGRVWAWLHNEVDVGFKWIAWQLLDGLPWNLSQASISSPRWVYLNPLTFSAGVVFYQLASRLASLSVSAFSKGPPVFWSPPFLFYLMQGVSQSLDVCLEMLLPGVLWPGSSPSLPLSLHVRADWWCLTLVSWFISILQFCLLLLLPAVMSSTLRLALSSGQNYIWSNFGLWQNTHTSKDRCIILNSSLKGT